MRSATTATGRPLSPPGKTLPKNRPAPLTSRAPRHPAAPKPHVTSQRQCYIPAPAVTRHSPLITRHCKFNRQPARLEFAISPTKQTPAPQFNRQLFGTFEIQSCTLAILIQRIAAPFFTNYESRFTSHAVSNRHSPRLENATSHRKQTLGTLSNRHFLQGPRSHQRRMAITDCPPHVATSIASNRQYKILDFTKNPTKTHI